MKTIFDLNVNSRELLESQDKNDDKFTNMEQ